MTYPVDDAGNPRVDFVWGNMAMQPDDQRDTVTSGPEPLYPANGEGNFGWDATYIYPSEGLYATVTQQLSVGDQSINKNWDDVSYRTVSVPADNHSTALTNYEGYPAFIQGAPYDDVIPNVTVPNIIGLTASAAVAALSAAGVTNYNNDGSNTEGATALNDGKVYFQSITGVVNNTSTVHFGTYHYVVDYSEHTNIAGFSVNSFPGHSALTGSEIYMFLTGRTTKPTALSIIAVADTTNTSLNRNYTVNTVEDNDSYNTGGTVCKLTAHGGAPLVDPNTASPGGYWIVSA